MKNINNKIKLNEEFNKAYLEVQSIIEHFYINYINYEYLRDDVIQSATILYDQDIDKID